jgi:hypothetical protein
MKIVWYGPLDKEKWNIHFRVNTDSFRVNTDSFMVNTDSFRVNTDSFRVNTDRNLDVRR